MAKMVIDIDDIEMEKVPDEDPDTSYLEQEEFKDRLAAYQRDEFSFLGIRATVDVTMPSGTIQTLTSPGIWGIETDSGDDYFQDVFEEERSQLIEDLEAMGITVEDDS